MLALALLSKQAAAINLDKIAGVVNDISATQSDPKNPSKKSASPLDGLQNDLLGKVEERVNKVTERIENRIAKYEQKFDGYEEKMDKAEKSIDRVVSAINSLDASMIQKYLNMAKYAVIAVAAVFLSMVILLIVVSVQLIRVNSLLKKKI